MPKAQAHDNEKYWHSIRKKMVDLDPESAERDHQARLSDPKHRFEFLEGSRKPIYIVADDPNNDGNHNLFACSPFVAARMIVDGSHRLATNEEARAWQEQQAEQKRQLDQAEARKQQPLVHELVSALAASQEQRRPGKQQQTA